MDSKLAKGAREDVPLYFHDFEQFWNDTFSNYLESDLVDCYTVSLIFKNWKISLNSLQVNKLDSLLDELHEDINASFFLAFFGLYRSAHMHLRSCIELSLQLLYFYQHEVEYTLWENGDFIIKHDQLITYLQRHPNLDSEKAKNLLNLISLNWRHFSKHIHAEQPMFFQSTKASHLSKKFTVGDFGRWKSNYLKNAYLLNKLLLFFFKSELNLFPSVNRKLLMRNMKNSDLKDLGVES